MDSYRTGSNAGGIVMYYNTETDRTAPASVWAQELGSTEFYIAVADGILIKDEVIYG